MKSKRDALGQRASGAMKMKKSEFSDQPNLPRRALLITGSGVAGLFALGAAASTEQNKPLVRPPQASESFSARCLKCDRCRSICPRGVVGVATFSDGLINFRTPVMDFKRGYCDFCGKCVEACPTAALLAFDKNTVKIGLAELTDNCIALRTSACTKCHESCPEKAITISDKSKPTIDPNNCNGCGKCVLVCPANVFQSFSGGDVRGIVIKPLDINGHGE